MRQHERKRFLAVMGNASDIGAWSGIPYYFYQAGKSSGFFQGALNLDVPGLRLPRLQWNLRQALLGRGMGGYQYSTACLQRTFEKVRTQVTGSEIISHFQLFPPLYLARKYGVVSNFYIDLPLSRLFDDYGIARTIGKTIASDAIKREQDGYLQADHVVCMSSWAARTVQEEYAVPTGKVSAILPGANLHEGLVEEQTAGLDEEPIICDFGKDRPFRFGFIGKDYQRKGLPRLVKAVQLLKASGFHCEVVVIGYLPEEYKQHPAVRWLGFIDKRYDEKAFIKSVMTFDLGCLLSYAEGLGISTLECLRLGVPVLGTDVGGITDCVPAKAGMLSPVNARPEEIASAVQPLLQQPDLYKSMRIEARRIRGHYSWARTVSQFTDLWRTDSPTEKVSSQAKEPSIEV